MNNTNNKYKQDIWKKNINNSDKNKRLHRQILRGVKSQSFVLKAIRRFSEFCFLIFFYQDFIYNIELF